MQIILTLDDVKQAICEYINSKMEAQLPQTIQIQDIQLRYEGEYEEQCFAGAEVTIGEIP